MGLEQLLEKRKRAIVDKWFERVVDTYPADTSRFLKRQKDPFANPVGRTTLKGLEGIFDQLLGAMDKKEILSLLDPIIRIRAIQDFTPSRAAGFIFYLKEIIHREFGEEAFRKEPAQALRALESRIDDLGLMGFDIFMNCREKVLDLKANEMRNRTYRAFKRAGLVKDNPDEDEPESM